MLSGVHPFSGASVTQMVAKMMTKEADPWPEPDKVPEVLKQIVARALRKDPSERYGSAGQVILDLLMARREIAARPVRGGVTREASAVAPQSPLPTPAPASPAVPATSPGTTLTESTAPMTRPKRTASMKRPRAGRRGPLFLFLAAALLLVAGGATVLSVRGCARLRPAGAAGTR
jgi:serine/threonine-protein kinase